MECNLGVAPHRRRLAPTWTGASSGSNPNTASPAPSGASADLSPDEVARYLFRKVVQWGRSSNVFLDNGARLYLDVGSHPEYATPECDNIPDLIAHDKAGERRLENLLMGAAGPAEGRGHRRRRLPLQEQHRLRRATPTAATRTTSSSRYGEFQRFADILIPFLVSRQCFAGAGKVLHTSRGALYCLSQRAEHIWEGVSSATTRSRPIINTRDEPHADAEKYRRLHVIVGDSNMCEVASFVKIGATADPAAHDRGERRHARHDAREPDPRDPRDLATT